MVGVAYAKRFPNSEVGQIVRFAEQDWTVVGHFAAGGSSFESEIWGENEQFMPVFRGEIFQSLTFRMKDPSAFEGLKTTLEADARLVVDAVQEHDFYAKQSTMLATILNFIAIFWRWSGTFPSARGTWQGLWLLFHSIFVFCL